MAKKPGQDILRNTIAQGTKKAVSKSAQRYATAPSSRRVYQFHHVGNLCTTMFFAWHRDAVFLHLLLL